MNTILTESKRRDGFEPYYTVNRISLDREIVVYWFTAYIARLLKTFFT